jgi:methyltransferase
MGEPILGWAILGVVVLERLGELLASRRNTARLLAVGGRTAPHDLTGWMVVVHTLGLAGIAAERLAGARVGGEVSWVAGAVLLVALAGRVWTLSTLGRRWTIRVVTVPGETPVKTGPYRWLRHPNYIVVLLEVFALPALLHAWITLTATAVPHVALLGLRIRREEAAWRRMTLETGGRP